MPRPAWFGTAKAGAAEDQPAEAIWVRRPHYANERERVHLPLAGT